MTTKNNYKHDPDMMKMSESKINELIKEYENKIKEIKDLVSEIYMSESWHDVKLKEIFNNTCKGYIELETNSLNNLILLMERFSMKLASIEEFENLYK